MFWCRGEEWTRPSPCLPKCWTVTPSHRWKRSCWTRCTRAPHSPTDLMLTLWTWVRTSDISSKQIFVQRKCFCFKSCHWKMKTFCPICGAMVPPIRRTCKCSRYLQGGLSCWQVVVVLKWQMLLALVLILVLLTRWHRQFHTHWPINTLCWLSVWCLWFRVAVWCCRTSRLVRRGLDICGSG